MSLISSTPISTHYKRLVPVVLVIALAFLVTACSDGGSSIDPPVSFVDPNTQIPEPLPDSIADNLRENVDYGTLLNLIEDADLTEALQDNNGGLGWTLFAPPDTAFVNDAFESLGREQMTSLVRNHLHSGRLAFSELNPGSLETTEGSVAVVENPDGTITVGGARIVARDRNFSNGIIHFVDTVLQSQ